MRTAFPTFEWVVNEAPSRRNRLRVPLAEARIGLVSTFGAYVRGQERLLTGDEGDASVRVVGWDEPVRFSHGGYDTRRAYRDAEVCCRGGRSIGSARSVPCRRASSR